MKTPRLLLVRVATRGPPPKATLACPEPLGAWGDGCQSLVIICSRSDRLCHASSYLVRGSGLLRSLRQLTHLLAASPTASSMGSGTARHRRELRLLLLHEL